MSAKYQKDGLGTRMKTYEEVFQNKLIRRMPVIIRLDGKAFHTFTKRAPIKNGCIDDPFSEVMRTCMNATALGLARRVQTAVFVYHQSDEISILLKDWDTLTTEPWFDNRVEKIVSIAAAMASTMFNRVYQHYEHIDDCADIPLFDARVFNLPKEEVNNYFIWRQQDATRNSINMLAQYYFSQKELHGKNVTEVQDMLMLHKGVDWNELATWKKRGTGLYKEPSLGWRLDQNTPIFTQDRNYIEQCLLPTAT